ncbi:MAG: hypothetical protein PHV17_08245 [Candidatus Omnitrophica bacterium]|nr:hypothetical protein [Candidatus Omnitrophota bacterium]
MMRIFFYFFIATFLLTQHSFSETMYLKNGDIVTGDIVESNSRFVKVNYYGVPLTYSRQDIERIESSNNEFGDESDVVIKLKGSKERIPLKSSKSCRLKNKTSSSTKKSARVKRGTCRRRCRRSGL